MQMQKGECSLQGAEPYYPWQRVPDARREMGHQRGETTDDKEDEDDPAIRLCPQKWVQLTARQNQLRVEKPRKEDIAKHKDKSQC